MGHVIEYRDAAGRFLTHDEGRTTWHSFSFGRHYDPADVGFAGLVAHNEELLPAGTGYAEHPHADLEIVTWVLDGSLRHVSPLGSRVLGPGQVQRLSAGSGVVHAETAEGGAVRFLQAWVRPDESGTPPDYQALDVTRSAAGWTCVADGAGHGAVPIGVREASLHVADLATGSRLDLPDAPLLHVFVAEGHAMLGERRLGPGDTARLTDEGERSVAAEVDAHLVVWAFGGPASTGSVVRGSAPRG